MAHDRGCEITEIQLHTVTIEQKERNSILLVQQTVELSGVAVEGQQESTGVVGPK
jgi:hypothetical protein